MVAGFYLGLPIELLDDSLQLFLVVAVSLLSIWDPGCAFSFYLNDWYFLENDLSNGSYFGIHLSAGPYAGHPSDDWVIVHFGCSLMFGIDLSVWYFIAISLTHNSILSAHLTVDWML